MHKAIIALCLLTGIAMGVGTYTFNYAKGFSYFSSDPRACINCHIMDENYESWQKSSHASWAKCNDCHTPHDNIIHKYYVKAENGWNHSVKFTLQNFDYPIQIREANYKRTLKACLHCHSGFVDYINAYTVEPGSQFDCIKCHPNVGHGPR